MKIKKPEKLFIYFVLVAPLMAKLLEWIVQSFTFPDLSHLSNGVWIIQLIFIEVWALIIYAVMTFSGRKLGINQLIWIAPLAYFFKEIFNLLFVAKLLNGPMFIAILIEPLVVLFLVTFLPSKLFFKKSMGVKV